MATRSVATIGNVFDLLKLRLPDGSPMDSIINAMAERDDFSRMIPAFPANNNLTHHDLRTISLPTGYLVDIGGSWKSSKAEREPVVEALMTIRSSYEAPSDTFTTMRPELGKKLLEAEKIAHVMTLNQHVTNVMLEGTTLPNQSAIVGLMKQPPYTTYDNKFTYNVGGTSDLRSCWMMKPGIDTVHTLYNPAHPTLGVEMNDKGEYREDGLGTGTDEHRYNICIEFMLQKGIFVRDQRAVKRICNVPCGIDDLPGADLITQIINASIINAPTGGNMSITDAKGQVSDLPSPWLCFCDERLYAKLVNAANQKLMVFKSTKNIYQTELPMIGDNIILMRMDALNKELDAGETEVAAA